jgi:hypothetical protein
VNGPGQMIAQMLWNGKEANMMKTFDQNGGRRGPELKEKKKWKKFC